MKPRWPRLIFRPAYLLRRTVRIGESTAGLFRLDFDRVSIERNDLHA